MLDFFIIFLPMLLNSFYLLALWCDIAGILFVWLVSSRFQICLLLTLIIINFFLYCFHTLLQFLLFIIFIWVLSIAFLISLFQNCLIRIIQWKLFPILVFLFRILIFFFAVITVWVFKLMTFYLLVFLIHQFLFTELSFWQVKLIFLFFEEHSLSFVHIQWRRKLL